jgi:cytoskeletal protein CcmA (bactofilin family)
VADNTDTTLGREATFTGRMTGSSLNVLGQLEGELELSGGLRVAQGGRVKATVKAGMVEIHGEFDGEIRAGTLVFGETARARGTFLSEKLSVREGAVVEGSVNLDRSRTAPAAAVTTPNAV